MAVSEDMQEEFEIFRDDLMREAEVSGDPLHAAFFRLYSELAAENGDCADLDYVPVIRESARPYQVDGYAFDRDRGELHLAICDYRPEPDLQSLNAERIRRYFQRVRRFCEEASDPDFVRGLEETSPTFELAWFIRTNLNFITRIRCILFTNSRLATKQKTIEAGRLLDSDITFNVIDFPRYLDIQRAMGGAEPIEIDVRDLNGSLLPCLEAHLENSDYQSYLAVIPGRLLAKMYGLFGARLMEQNVRTFLQARTKANQGIIKTASDQPEMFFAYNNGITATATDVTIERNEDGTVGISKIQDLQIVNGGQTTASLLYAKDRGQTDLSHVFVQMKLSVVQPDRIDEVVPKISRFANTQNRISEADFFSSHAYHIEMQQISRRLSAPVAEGSLAATKWFYERARGQYRNEIALRSRADQSRFKAEFPQSQVIQKTDLAKYEITFDARPHIVSLGAQKCFLRFAEETTLVWEKSSTNFNDEYFRNAVAKAIVFRWLDKAVGNSEWYKADRGYKANIVTYTIAWLVNHLEQDNGKVIDFGKIWQSQGVTDGLQVALDQIAPNIARALKSLPSGVSNVSEYAKSKSCWDRISALDIDFHVNPNDFSVDKDEAREKAREARTAKKVDHEIDFEMMLLENLGRMRNVHLTAKNRGLLSPRSDTALTKLFIGASGLQRLTRSEKNALKYLFERLNEIGEGPQNWAP